MPACQNLDSSTKGTRLTVCFDARALMYISRSSANRSGITLSAYQVLLALSKICEVRLFCELEFYTLCKRECAKLESLQGFSFVNRFSLVERALSYLCYQKYSICHYLRERNHPILDRAMRAVFLPFIILARYHKLGSSTLESMQSCDILFSPYYAFAKEIAALDSVRFTLLHDVIPIVYEEHFRMSDIPIDKLLRQVLRQRHDFYDIADSLNVKDFYITNSAFTKADFLKHFPTRLCESHISVALLGADREIFYRDFDERKNAQIRERYHIPHNARYIFSLCSLDPRKNLIFVARNFIECIKKHNIDDLVLVLGGGAWESFIGELESSFDSLGEWRSKIIRAGYVEDRHLANLFSHSLASVYLSTYEGFGLPVLESMSCGCPTIASSTTSVPEVLGSGGIALDPNDALGLQEAIYKIYSDESYARELSQRALEQAGRFSWGACAGEIYSAFSHALGKQDSALGEQCGSVAKIVKGTTAKVANLPQSLQSSHSPTAIPRILEENQANQLSLRVDLSTKQSNSAQAESNQINGARKACNLESVALGLGAKGVKKEGGIRESSLPIQAPPSPLERTLSQAKLESSHTAQKVDSSMDCHALPCKARNDRKLDSANTAILSEPAKDSRICDEKSGLSSDWQGSYLSGNDRRQSRRIADLSRKAESTKESQSLKHLHRIFFGFNDERDIYTRYLETWQQQLPDFEIRFYNASNLPLDLNPYTKALSELKDGVFLGDYYRWWLIYHYGGVYLDADIEVVSGEKFRAIISELESSEYEMIIGIEDKVNGGYTSHAMAGKKGAKLAKFMCEIYENLGKLYLARKELLISPKLAQLYFLDQGEFVETKGFCGDISEPIIKCGVKIYPKDYFSPLSVGLAPVLEDLSPNTTLAHHCASSWWESGSRFDKHKQAFQQYQPLLSDYVARSKSPRFILKTLPKRLFIKLCFPHGSRRRAWAKSLAQKLVSFGLR